MTLTTEPERATPLRLNGEAEQPEPHEAVKACRHAADRCACIVAAFFLVDPEQLRKATRGTAIESFARQVWMAGLVSELGFSSLTVGRAIGRDKSTVEHACSIIEGLRGGMDPEDLAYTLGNEGVTILARASTYDEYPVSRFLADAENVLDKLYAAFVLVAVQGEAYTRSLREFAETAKTPPD